MPKHPIVRMFLYGTIASVVGVVIVLAIDWFPSGGHEGRGRIDWLYDVLMIVSVPIFVLVMSVAIYSVIRFRASPGDMGDGAPIHGNARLEVIWVLVPFIIVSVLAAYAWIVLDDIEAPSRASCASTSSASSSPGPTSTAARTASRSAPTSSTCRSTSRSTSTSPRAT